MELSRMLTVVNARFEKWNPKTSVFGDEGFRIEFDNTHKTERILLRGKSKLDGKFEWDVKGSISSDDIKRIEEIKKVITNALV